MEKDSKYWLPPIVIMALVLAVTLDYCQPIPQPKQKLHISPSPSVSITCYIKRFGPETPEARTSASTSNSYPFYAMSPSVSLSGTTTTPPSPSPAFEDSEG